MKLTIGLMLIISLALAACQTATPSPLFRSTPVTATEQPFPTLQADSTTSPVEKNVVQTSIRDLSLHLDIPRDQVKVISVEKTTWPDASLGCPKPGVMYIQMVTPGFTVLLEANDNEYVYHTDRTGQVVLCPEIKPDEPGLR